MDPCVTVVIPDLAGPAALARTRAALARHTPEPHAVVLLVEGAGPAELAPVPGNPAAGHMAGPAPLNVPAGLNRVLAATTTPYLLLLESGAVVTAGWLDRLLAALADPAAGLAGPSTNVCWNEQQVGPRGEGLDWPDVQIDAWAATVAARPGPATQPLDTLHSLADFCYLFRRVVAEQLGGFDAAYGAGPCWEVDFNTRAARAGYRGLWVPAAYVHRGHPAPARAQLGRRLFPANKQLYQDRFCGLRLRGERHDYEPGCRGEACPHFAPAALITVRLAAGGGPLPLPLPGAGRGVDDPLPQPTREVDGPLPRPLPGAGRGVDDPLPQPGRGVANALPAPAGPLVSCIMPTRNRRAFLPQALAYFARQHYAERELIVVDDGDDPVADLLPRDDPRVRYVAAPPGLSIGAKRNLACEHARGAIIAHWDDDDWYAPHRLREQVAPLLAGTADVSGLETPYFFDLARWEAWTASPALHRRLFVGDVHGGTLVYWRWVWERLARYPPLSLAEDGLFLREALRRGARLARLPGAGAFVYIRHGANAWGFVPGTYLDAAGWARADPEACIPPADRAFYAARHAALSGATGAARPAAAPVPPVPLAPRGVTRPGPAATLAPPRGVSQQQDAQAVTPLGPATAPLPWAVTAPGAPAGGPLVSCIMPTYDRRAFVPLAIRHFLAQDYPARELLILDDGPTPVADLVPPDPRIRYIRLPQRLILGAKRNHACELAAGPLIAHWDDDDWHAPQRLSAQVALLEAQRADLCGTSRLLYYDVAGDCAWLYEYPAALRRWLAGGTLLYRKAFWAQNPFPAIGVGEDTRFAWSPQATRLAILPDHRVYVGLIHAANTSRKTVTGAYWRPHPVAEVRALLGADLAAYRGPLAPGS